MVATRKFLTPLIVTTLLTLGGCNYLPTRSDDPSPADKLPPKAAETTPAAPQATPELPSVQDGHIASTAALEVIAPLTEAPTEQLSEEPGDLWQRIRGGYRLQIPENERINRSIKWYAAHDDYLQRIQQRAEPYLYFIVEEIEKRDMPMELALLPVVESAFRPFAYSPGRAAGIWQFIPSTGKAYGLHQNWWYDGRRDIVAATRAALDYLASLAKRFDGDWELALAAYNAGGGTVQRAIRKNRKSGKPTDYWSLDLPTETERYVPKLLAVAQLINRPGDHSLTFDSIPDTPYFSTVDIESQLDLALAAEMADISIETLYQLNPGFNRWASPPEGPHRLNIPVGQVDRFNDKLAALKPDQRLRWKRYQIRPGDSLNLIAKKHSTTVALLRQTNKLKGNKIRAGKHLLIPIASEQPDHYLLSSEQRRAKKANSGGKGDKIIYKVRAGDSFWSIARKHNISHKSLARWNGLSPRDTLRPGQKLTLWLKKAAENRPETIRSSLALGSAALPVAVRNSRISYQVRKGDSLALIAQRFNIQVADLKRWNSLADHYLQPGQNLRLYVNVANQTL